MLARYRVPICDEHFPPFPPYIEDPLNQNFIEEPVSVNHTAYSWHQPMGTHIQYHNLQAYVLPAQ